VKLLLASQSAARKRMLEAACVPFEVVSPAFDEEAAKAQLRTRRLGAAALAKALAERKALAVPPEAGSLVLASDQTLETEGGELLDKPKSPEDLGQQLRLLSGKPHRLHSAAVITENGCAVWSATESATVTMRPLGEDFLQTYVAREYETVRWSVGGYHVEGRGVQLFEKTEGSYFAVLGLPLLPLLAYLRERGVLAS
jgi:septum formation protein